MSELKNKQLFMRIVSSRSTWPTYTGFNTADGVYEFFNKLKGAELLREYFYPENKEEVLNLIKLVVKDNIELFINGYIEFMEVHADEHIEK